MVCKKHVHILISCFTVLHEPLLATRITRWKKKARKTSWL